VHFHLTGGERVSKKKSIIDAAAFLFAEKGFYAATVEEIAIQAGIGKSSSENAAFPCYPPCSVRE
jgi:DNA-binding transcriptional regulator YbjK